MKTPITYYGGKLNMVKDILPLFPNHNLYCEPFFGGGSLFFAKEPSVVEVINDLNSEVVNFFIVLKTDFKALKEKIDCTLHSRVQHKVAYSIYQLPTFFTPLQRAWAFWILTNQGFSGKIGSWGYSRFSNKTKALKNKKLAFDRSLAERLEHAQIECNDAIKVIQSRDGDDSFFYIDPPYIDVNQGHYAGYAHADYIALLDTLVKLKGKFLLSSYPTDILDEYIKKYNWNSKSFVKPLSASRIDAQGKRKQKIEVLVANYTIK